MTNNIFTALSKHIPFPATELQYINNFTLTIAVLLSAQSTDKQVNKIMKPLFEQYDTPAKMLTIPNLQKQINSIGLYKTKAKNIISLCHMLIQKFNSTIPSTFEELIMLPGIGRKSANVILNTAFGQNTIAVDTHVNRVAKRLHIANQDDNIIQVEKKLLQKIDQKWLKNAHHYLVLHGRYTCKAINPQCAKCPLAEMCPSNILKK